MNRIKSVHNLLHLGALAAVMGIWAPVSVEAGQIQSSVYYRLDSGMEDSEVLILAGPPDLVTSPGGEVIQLHGGVAEGFHGARGIRSSGVSRWHYVPDASEHDPYLTIITVKGGRVFRIDRKKVLSRDGLPRPARENRVTRRIPRDDEIVRRRLERTMEAAEHYARTRARLKREEIELLRAAADLPAVTAEEAEAKVYRGKDDDGVVYYGDRPPQNGLPNVVDF
ncbi:MAG: hypothetical protein R3174_09310 [Gammaproteobacteria bacterium]|nr:hypothetical protein [Gammaproteobacteria bacterium]